MLLKPSLTCAVLSLGLWNSRPICSVSPIFKHTLGGPKSSDWDSVFQCMGHRFPPGQETGDPHASGCSWKNFCLNWKKRAWEHSSCIPVNPKSFWCPKRNMHLVLQKTNYKLNMHLDLQKKLKGPLTNVFFFLASISAVKANQKKFLLSAPPFWFSELLT